MRKCLPSAQPLASKHCGSMAAGTMLKFILLAKTWPFLLM